MRNLKILHFLHKPLVEIEHMYYNNLGYYLHVQHLSLQSQSTLRSMIEFIRFINYLLNIRFFLIYPNYFSKSLSSIFIYKKLIGAWLN